MSTLGWHCKIHPYRAWLNSEQHIMFLPKYKTQLEFLAFAYSIEMRSRAKWNAFACSMTCICVLNWNTFAFTCSLKLKCFCIHVPIEIEMFLHSRAPLNCIRVLNWNAFAFIPSSIEILLHSRVYRPDRWSRRFWHRGRFRLARARRVHLGDLFDNTRLLWC